MVDEDTVDAILDAAKFLRGVRPLDPTELRAYVAAEVQASSVHQVLQAHAVELEIYEADDGTFRPVPEEPRTPTFDGIRELPNWLTAEVIDMLTGRFGDEWAAGETGDRLRTTIRGIKSAYFAGGSVTYDRDAVYGYTIYHLPSTYAKVQYVLDVLCRSGLVPPAVRVLEVGPGVGAAALGMADYVGDRWPVAYRGIEPSDPAAAIAERLLSRTPRNFHWDLQRGRIESAELTGPYDLIVLANVLNELDEPLDVLERLLRVLADDGTLVVIAPADERTSRTLRETEQQAVERSGPLEVYAPTIRLWPDQYPADRCWSFDEHTSLSVPPFQRRLDEGRRASPDERDPATGEFVNVDVRYSYSLLRTDGRRYTSYRPSRARFAPLCEASEQVGERVNVAVTKLSNSLSQGEDAHPLYVIGDGSQQAEHFAVWTRETGLNRSLEAAPYGGVLTIERGLMLWNADEEAFNLVVDGETIVDRIAGP